MSIELGGFSFDFIDVDARGDTLFVRRGDESAAAETVESEEGHVVDLGADGEVLAIEFLNVLTRASEAEAVPVTIPGDLELRIPSDELLALRRGAVDPARGRAGGAALRGVGVTAPARKSESATIAPYLRGLGCRCDPFGDLGPFGHDPDCPARDIARKVALNWEYAAPLLEALAREIVDQDRRYGTFFPGDVQAVRLAVAALEDETEEVRRAWKVERKADGWPELRAELLQVIAIGVRLMRDTDPRDLEIGARLAEWEGARPHE